MPTKAKKFRNRESSSYPRRGRRPSARRHWRGHSRRESRPNRRRRRSPQTLAQMDCSFVYRQL